MFGLDDAVTVTLTVRQWNFVLRLLLRFGVVYKALPIINAISEQAKAQAEASPPAPKAPPAATINLASEKLVRRPPRGSAADQAMPPPSG